LWKALLTAAGKTTLKKNIVNRGKRKITPAVPGEFLKVFRWGDCGGMGSRDVLPGKEESESSLLYLVRSLRKRNKPLNGGRTLLVGGGESSVRDGHLPKIKS